MKCTKVFAVLCMTVLLLSPLQGSVVTAAEAEFDTTALPEEELAKLMEISAETGTDIKMARVTENGIVNATVVSAANAEATKTEESVTVDAVEAEPDTEIPVVQAGESWRADLKARVVEGLLNYEILMDVSDLNIPYTSDEETFRMLNELLTEIEYEYPDIFYVEQALFIMYEGDNPEGNKLLKVNFLYNYGFTDTNPYYAGLLGGEIVPEKVEACRAALHEALSYVTDEMSTVEKLLVLHDYLALNCEFDYKRLLASVCEEITEDTSWESYSAYGALVNRKVIKSNAYAYAYQCLMQYIGVESYIVTDNDETWNMVNVDGCWYHVDVAHDDPIFTYNRFDAYGDEIPEDRIYARDGFVSHECFLLSDEEVIDRGYHYAPEVYQWFCSYATPGTVPTASNSGSYAGYIFRENALYTAVTYHNGEWYYVANERELDTDILFVSGHLRRINMTYYEQGEGYIVKSDVDGSNAGTLEDLGVANYAQVEGDYLYYSRVEDLYTDGIYAVKLNGSLVPERVMTPVGAKGYHTYAVDEFSVRNDVLVLELVNPSDADKWVHLQYPLSKRETTMPTLKIVSDKVNYPEGIGAIATDALPVKLCYSDGTQVGVDYIPGNVTITSTGESIYTIGVEWRGMTAAKEISADIDWPIEDVLSVTTNWMYVPIKYVYNNGYMKGTSEATFAPGEKMERCMVAQILYSMEGKPEVTYTEKFADVPESGWYSSAVTWAYENKVVSGYNADTFGTYDYVTREQLAIMLMKYAEVKGIDTDARADLSGYADTDKISSYARDAIEWAVAVGVMAGKNENLDPLGNATRAEGAAMIRSFCEKVRDM